MTTDLNILITGSEGAIGSRLVDALTTISPTSNIIRVSRKQPSCAGEAPLQQLLIGDLLDAEFVKSIFDNFEIHVVIFCAAKWNGLNQDPVVLNDNVTMFNNVLATLATTVTNFIYLSSSAIYPAAHCIDSALIDSLPPSSYGKSKLIN